MWTVTLFFQYVENYETVAKVTDVLRFRKGLKMRDDFGLESVTTQTLNLYLGSEHVCAEHPIGFFHIIIFPFTSGKNKSCILGHKHAGKLTELQSKLKKKKKKKVGETYLKITWKLAETLRHVLDLTTAELLPSSTLVLFLFSENESQKAWDHLRGSKQISKA